MKVNIDTSDMLYAEAWNGFKGTDWKEEINVRDFIQHNYTPYEGDESFLAEATPATTALWEKVMAGIRIENSTHAPVILIPILRRQLPHTMRVILNRNWKKSSVCKRISHSSVLCIRLAAST